MRVFVESISSVGTLTSEAVVDILVRDNSNAVVTNGQFSISLGTANTAATIKSAIESEVIYALAQSSITVVAGDFIWLFDPTITPQVRTVSFPTRSLDTAFQLANDTFVSYSVEIQATLSLTGGQLGSVVLEYADNSGMSTNLKTVCIAKNGNTGSLTIGLNTVQTVGSTLSGYIPAGKYVRLRSVDTTSTPTQTYVSAQEVAIS